MPDEIQNQPAPTSAPTPVPVPSTRSTDQVGLRVSLIPAEEMERNDPRRGFRKFLTVVIVFVVVIGGVIGYLGLSVYSNLNKVAGLKTQTDALVKQSADLAPSVRDASLAQARLKALSSLLAQHQTGLKLLSFLEAHTLPDVSYSSLSVSDNGAVSLAVSASTFESYAAQINELRSQPEIKNLVSSGVTPTYDDKNNLLSVSFTMTLALDPSIFSEVAPAKK